jgi:hypothetical protein
MSCDASVEGMPPTPVVGRVSPGAFVDVRPAPTPSLRPVRVSCHAGPPLAGWGEACGALRGAIAGTLMQLGRIRSLDMAEGAVGNEEVRLSPANDVNALATYGGVISRRTPLLVVENRTSGVCAFAALNEGRGRALRIRAPSGDAIALAAKVSSPKSGRCAPSFRRNRCFGILARALHMGDDSHSRQKAASALFLNAIAPFLVETRCGRSACSRAWFMAQ